MKHIKTLTAIYILLMLVACSSKQQQSSDDNASANEETTTTNDSIATLTQAQVNNAGIVTGAPVSKTLHSTLLVNGMIDVPPQNIISVSFPLGGYLKKMTLLPGMPIKKGQVLAVLEDQQYIQLQQDYLTAKSRLEYSTADYARQTTLNETKATSDKVLQQAKATYTTDKIMVSSLAEKLQLININPARLNETNISRSIPVYSPITGYISKVNVNPGKYVNPTDILFELLDPSDIHLGLSVFEQDVQYLHEGQKVMGYTNNEPGKKYAATIILINHNIDENRASEVHCHFEKYDSKLLPGMFMKAEIAISSATTQAVPNDAILRWQSKYYIFSDEGGNHFKMVQVQPGSSSDGYTAISQPVLTGKLVVKNAYSILMLMKNKGDND